MTTAMELYRTPTLATLSHERLAVVVREYRQELMALAHDCAYAGANWALELIDSLSGRVAELERTLAQADPAPVVYVEPAPAAPAEDAEAVDAAPEAPRPAARRAPARVHG